MNVNYTHDSYNYERLYFGMFPESENNASVLRIRKNVRTGDERLAKQIFNTIKKQKYKIYMITRLSLENDC